MNRGLLKTRIGSLVLSIAFCALLLTGCGCTINRRTVGMNNTGPPCITGSIVENGGHYLMPAKLSFLSASNQEISVEIGGELSGSAEISYLELFADIPLEIGTVICYDGEEAEVTEYYKAFLECVGYSTKNTSPLWGTNKLPFTDYGLYAPSTADKEGYAFNCNVSGAQNIPYLAYVLPTDEWGKDKADGYVVSWQQINEWMKGYHDTYDKPKNYITPKPDGAPSGWVPSSWTFNPPYNGEYLEADGVTYAYSRALFESWDEKKTVVDIPRDKKLSLTSEKISQSWWQKMFGGSGVVSSTTFDDIEAIYCVAASDFKASKQLTCDGLYISLSDYDDFKKFYDTATKQDETVVLLRFDVGEYSALEASEGIPYDGNGVLQGIKTGDTNARLFQMNVYLGFDIISLPFDNGEETFVIPVVSDPIDAGGASTGALHTNSDKDNRKLFFSLLILVILLIFLQLTGILPGIVRLIFWLIELPFRAIAWVFKSIGNAVKKKKGG